MKIEHLENTNLQFQRILIIGVGAGLGHTLIRNLIKKYPKINIWACDSRPILKKINAKNIHYLKIKYSRGEFESLFRSHQFDIVYYLGRITGPKNSHYDLSQKLDLNIMGTGNIFELSHHFKVKKIIVLSSFYVYGASATNSAFMNEEHPLRASIKYPELRDVVERDQLSTNYMWKYQSELEVIVFRPTHIIGQNVANAITTFLTQKKLIVPIDYSPMFQFIHEYDMANLLIYSLNHLSFGIYNVALQNEYISLKEIANLLNKKTLPLSMFILGQLLNFTKKTTPLKVPNYLIDYLKFPSLIEADKLKKLLPEDFFRFSTRGALTTLKDTF